MTDDTKPPADEPTPPEQPADEPTGLQFEQLEHCPTPGVCFPYGLPVDASHAACVHGETFAHANES